MDNLVPATVAENRRNFSTLMASDEADVAARIGREAPPGLGTGTRADDDAVAALAGAFDCDDAGTQRAPAAAPGASGAVIDDECAGRIDRGRDPRLARRS